MLLYFRFRWQLFYVCEKKVESNDETRRQSPFITLLKPRVDKALHFASLDKIVSFFIQSNQTNH